MMGKQSIAVKGLQDEDSNFMAMLSLLAKENAPRISKYTCPDIKNEIIFFSAKQILDGLIDNCKRSVIYALIADESTDVTNKEEISICIRFVGRKEDGRHLISEEFLTFVHADKGSNAEELTTKLLETIQSVGFSVNDMRAQGYDEWAREWCANTDSSSKSKCCLCPLSTSRLKPLYCPCIKASTCEKHHGYHARSYVGL